MGFRSKGFHERHREKSELYKETEERGKNLQNPKRYRSEASAEELTNVVPPSFSVSDEEEVAQVDIRGALTDGNDDTKVDPYLESYYRHVKHLLGSFPGMTSKAVFERVHSVSRYALISTGKFQCADSTAIESTFNKAFAEFPDEMIAVMNPLAKDACTKVLRMNSGFEKSIWPLISGPRSVFHGGDSLAVVTLMYKAWSDAEVYHSAQNLRIVDENNNTSIVVRVAVKFVSSQNVMVVRFKIQDYPL
jgi:hypothetical protein